MVNQLDNSIRVIGCSDWIFDDNLNIEPIPLTPEILEKCGFEKYDYYPDCECYKVGNYFVSMSEDIWLHQSIGKKQAVILRENMSYLHQLQNLYYALTNTELPITL